MSFIQALNLQRWDEALEISKSVFFEQMDLYFVKANCPVQVLEKFFEIRKPPPLLRGDHFGWYCLQPKYFNVIVKYLTIDRLIFDIIENYAKHEVILILAHHFGLGVVSHLASRYTHLLENLKKIGMGPTVHEINPDLNLDLDSLPALVLGVVEQHSLLLNQRWEFFYEKFEADLKC